MYFLDLTLATLAENLALDEALVDEADVGGCGEVLRLWEWPRAAVVLGAGARLAAEVDESACRADAVPILRRGSGGGTVLLDTGCLIFSLVLSYDRARQLKEIRSSYRFILSQIARALADLLPDVRPAGISDLVAGSRKFSGNSQHRKREFLLHHGTLLYDFDLAKVSRYLRMPERQPDYRAGRSHEDFLINLSASASELHLRLRQTWNANEAVKSWPRERAERLVAEKYGSVEWIRRR